MTTTEFLSKEYGNEDVLSSHVHLWINNNFPGLRHFYFHIPNELSMIVGETQQSFSRRLQRHMACGVLPGVPDFQFLLPYVWFMELKMPNGSKSPAQAKLHPKWQGIGLSVELCNSKQSVVDATLTHCKQFYKPI